MSRETQFIRKAGVTPVKADTLPTDITDLVLRRLVIMCLFTAGLGVLGSSMNFIMPYILQGTFYPDFMYSLVEFVIDSSTVLISLGFAWAVHRRKFSPRVLMALGLVFGVYVAMWLSVGETFGLVRHKFGPIAYFSFTQAWVVFFPAIVPYRLRATVVTVVLMSAMAPTSRWVVQSIGWIELPEDSQPSLIFMMSFSAILGVAVSQVVYKLGKSVKAARELGSYHLEEMLGKGGMGEVWRASHKMLARPAAVKLIRKDAAGSGEDGGMTLLKRFENEAQATASLRSPHTIQIYDFGLSPDGTFFYVMELLDGVDLETLVEKQGPQPAERVIFLLEQACHSLHEAHQTGLVHRDIKPANLFVCKYGSDYDFLKVLDFGLVKEHKDEVDTAKLTQHGSVVGTPGYLPPELALGKSKVDGRADLYALGCVAYWLLTGKLLFDTETPMEMVVKHVNETPRPPSTRSELVIPPELEKIVMSCLEKDPAKRPQSAGELAESLKSCPREKEWTPQRAEKWWGVHRQEESHG